MLWSADIQPDLCCRSSAASDSILWSVLWGPTRLLWYPRAYCGVHALIIHRRINIRYRVSFDIELWIFNIKEESSISNLLNRYRGKSISDFKSISDYQYRIVLWISYCWLKSISVNTIPHCFRGKIPREAAADSRPDSGTGSRIFQINMWMWHYGRTFPRQISVDQAVEFRKKRVQEAPWLVALRLFGAGVMQPGQRELSLRSEWHWANAISYTISTPVFFIWPSILKERKAFDIIYDINIRYRTFHVRCRRDETLISTSLFMTVTFDIDIYASIA